MLQRMSESQVPGPPSDARVELVVPAAEAHLSLLRTVAGRQAMMAGFTFDGIEDLALAVHEAAAVLLLGRPDRISLSVWPDGDGLMVELEAGATTDGWRAPDEEVRWHLLETLCDRVWWLDGRTGVGISYARR